MIEHPPRRLPDSPEAILALWAQVSDELRAYVRERSSVGKGVWARARAGGVDLPPWSTFEQAAAHNRRHNDRLEIQP